MAKVYTGKVAIPADKFEEFLKALEDAQKAREPFRKQLEELNREFNDYLMRKVSERTANKHSSVVDLFIEFICRYTDVECIEEITRGMVNTNFKQWWKRKVLDSTTPDQITVALRKFFVFLAVEKGIVNDKAMKGLQ